MIPQTPTAVDGAHDPIGTFTARVAPNPIRPASVLSWSKPVAGTTDLLLLDVAGRSIAQLRMPLSAAGRHVVPLTELLPAGSGLPQGVYLLRLRFADGSVERTRITVVRGSAGSEAARSGRDPSEPVRARPPATLPLA